MEKTLAQLIEESMMTTANAYAADDNMTAATAIHDAFLCLERDLKNAGLLQKDVDTQNAIS